MLSLLALVPSPFDLLHCPRSPQPGTEWEMDRWTQSSPVCPPGQPQAGMLWQTQSSQTWAYPLSWSCCWHYWQPPPRELRKPSPSSRKRHFPGMQLWDEGCGFSYHPSNVTTSKTSQLFPRQQNCCWFFVGWRISSPRLIDNGWVPQKPCLSWGKPKKLHIKHLRPTEIFPSNAEEQPHSEK